MQHSSTPWRPPPSPYHNHEPPINVPPNDRQVPHEAMSGPQYLPPHYGQSSSTGPHPSPVYPPNYYGQHQTEPYGANYGQPPPTGPHSSLIHLTSYYGQHQTGSYGADQRRKAARAIQACDSCRKRKAKCDEGRPACNHCKDNNLGCVYRDVPQKQDKQSSEMMEILNTIFSQINRVIEGQKNQARVINALHLRILASGLSQDPGKMTSPYTTDEFTSPVKDTTAAQSLFSWPSVRIILPKDRPEDYTESYVMDLELKRGLLRLYGCGEGEDKNDGGTNAPTPANNSDSGIRADGEGAIALPEGGDWGSGQLPVRSPGPDPTGGDYPGGVSATGGLILNADLVDTWVNSYLANIYILHPFLEIKVLQDMATHFKRRYSWAHFHLQHRSVNTRKCKHAGVVEIEHSISNAIILLVLALGKICAHKSPLPGPILDSSIQSNKVHLGIKVESPGSVISGPSDTRGKNMDVIPGLAYFTVAADILGELPGGGDVSHIQANLLAGLYMSQLARPIPSYFYISNACNACQVLIESSEYRSQTINPSRKNLIKLVFWTCLQLECDILAEIPLPPSGITRYEARMIFEMPNGVTLEPNLGEADPNSNIFRILRFYSTQIQLRRTLNDIHSNLYKGKDKELPYDQKPPLKIIESLNMNLEAWRSSLGDWNWSDQDHKSNDINVARMRAKYYGAKYLICRPALRYLLGLQVGFASRSSSMPGSRTPESPLVGPSYCSQQPSPATQHSQASGFVGRRQTITAPLYQNSFEEVQATAEACVAAAIRSTTVFDSVPERIIITNIFGTAHAQFGNMLVLAATYNAGLISPATGEPLVETTELETLFNRSIHFLKLNRAISPTLERDMEILEYIQQILFPNQTSSAYASFTLA